MSFRSFSDIAREQDDHRMHLKRPCRSQQNKANMRRGLYFGTRSRLVEQNNANQSQLFIYKRCKHLNRKLAGCIPRGKAYKQVLRNSPEVYWYD